MTKPMTSPNPARDGWKLVPVEPTRDMQHAYFDEIDRNMKRVETDAAFGRYSNHRLAYAKMLAAAPAAKPPASGVDAADEGSIAHFLRLLDQVNHYHSDVRGDAHDDLIRFCQRHAEALRASLSPAATSGSEAGGNGVDWDDLHGRLSRAMPSVLAKPASSPAGGDVDDAWRELCERDDRTSPEEYPDMCLITRDELAEFMARAALSPSPSAAEPVACGPFGHHPDPSTDFCVEVETLEGWAEDVKAGTRSQWPFWGRLSALLRFVRSDEFAGLDGIAQRAKATVFELEGRGTGAPPAPAAVDGQKVKALEWTYLDNGGAWAHTRFGISYHVMPDGSWCERNGEFLSAGGTLDEAKAAAQNDYEARIRACLATDKEGA